MPANVPYGAPITAARARAVIQAAEQGGEQAGMAHEYRGGRIPAATSSSVLADGRRSIRQC